MTIPTHRTHNDHLKRVLNFGDNDLAMNRLGKISDTQRTRLEKERQGSSKLAWGIGLFCAILAGLLIVFVISLSNQRVTNYLNPLLLGVLLTGLIIMLSAIRVRNGTREDLALNRVESTTGFVKRHTEQHEGAPRYYITINDKSYGVPQTVYEAFQEDIYYRFYHTARAFTLMSVEVIDAESANQSPAT